jgi:hypothetical protein
VAVGMIPIPIPQIPSPIFEHKMNETKTDDDDDE